MDYKSQIWVSVITLLVGIVLMVLNGMVATSIVIILGILFIVTGVVSMALQFTGRDASGKRSVSVAGVISAAAAVILGIIVVTAPEASTNLIIRLLGVFAVLAGGYQIYSMLFTYRAVGFAGWIYIIPALVFGFGVFMICSPSTFVNILVLVSGIALAVYGIGSLIQVFSIMNFNRRTSRVIDVEAKEVKSEPEERGNWPSDRS